MLVSGSVGPLLEGDTLRLTCRARGGLPPPTVTWWEAATPLDLNMEVQELPEVNNLLVVPKLTRDDLHRTFVCQASNSNLTAPLVSTVKLDMNCKSSTGSLEALSQSLIYLLLSAYVWKVSHLQYIQIISSVIHLYAMLLYFLSPWTK